MEKVQNLLKFEDFEKNWKAKDLKKTKRTDVGLDIIEENLDEIEMNDEIVEDDIDDEEIIEDDELDEVEEDDDDTDWKDQLISLIDEIIEGGEDPEDVIEFVTDHLDDVQSDDDDDIQDELIIDDDEGKDVQMVQDIQKNVKSFKNWKK